MSCVLSRVTFENPLAPFGGFWGERVASVANRVRGSGETVIVENYTGHDTSLIWFLGNCGIRRGPNPFRNGLGLRGLKRTCTMRANESSKL